MRRGSNLNEMQRMLPRSLGGTPSLFYKGWPIRDGNMGLVGIPEFFRDNN